MAQKLVNHFLCLIYYTFCILFQRDRYIANDFKRIGSDDLSDKRAILISGPPGIGKTTTAHLVAQIEGWIPIEFNASDVRSKSAIDVN